MNTALPPDHRPVLNEVYQWEPLPDGCVLFEEATGKMLTLNPPAEAVLALCDGEATVEKLLGQLEQEFGIVAVDGKAALQQLIMEGVIKLVPG